MKNMPPVYVDEAPGYGWFEGWEYDRVAAVDGRGELSIIIDDGSEFFIIPSKHVTYVTS